jgi:hypothetical protein
LASFFADMPVYLVNKKIKKIDEKQKKSAIES